MSVSHALQDVIGDVSAAIASRDSWDRVKLEKLRRSLNAIARESGQAERAAGRTACALTELREGVQRGVADLHGLAQRAMPLVVAEPAQ